MKTVSGRVKFRLKASRLELIIRFPWLLVANIVLMIFSFVAGLLTILHWLYILIVGKRIESVQGFVKSVVLQRFYIRSYGNLLTDERPPIIPKMVRA